VSVKRASSPLARLLPLLLATAFAALLGWHLVRTDRGEPSMQEQTVAPRERFPRVSAPEPVPGTPSPDHPLSMPVAGVDPRALHDDFAEGRGGGTRPHEALDIPAPRGTPVLAVEDGVVRKLFTSVPGGLTVYQFDLPERYCYYYAHLDGYAPGLHEGQSLRRGDVVGYVGTTGNAPKNTPHLHFAVSRLDPDKRWWTGTPVDPYPLLVKTAR
jgi:murein DD-endopeptidase MepM/ murein hydrolase activator NlpD